MVPGPLSLVETGLRGVDIGLSFGVCELLAVSLELLAVWAWLLASCLLLLAVPGGLSASCLLLLAAGILLLAVPGGLLAVSLWLLAVGFLLLAGYLLLLAGLLELLLGGALVWVGRTCLRVVGTGLAGMDDRPWVAMNGALGNFFREFSVPYRWSCKLYFGTYII